MNKSLQRNVIFYFFCVAFIVLAHSQVFAMEPKLVAGDPECNMVFWLRENSLVMLSIALLLGAATYAKQIPFLLGMLIIILVVVPFREANKPVGSRLFQSFGCTFSY